MERISEKTLKNVKEHLKTAKKRFEAQVSPQINVLRAQLDVAKAEQNLNNMRSALQNSRLALASLLGQQTFSSSVLTPPSPKKPGGTPLYWMKLALKKRVEMESTGLDRKIAEEQRIQAWLQFVPTLGFAANLQWSNVAGFAGQNTTWNLGLTLNIPLYDGGKRYTALREANNQKQRARIQQKKIKLQIQQEVRKALIELKNAELAMTITRKQRLVAQKNYEQQRKRYEAGMTTPLMLSDSSTQLQTAEIQELRESLNRDLSIFSLRRAIGLSLQP